MARTASINTRIEPEVKEKAESIFAAIGITASDAISMFYRQVVFRRGLPFDVCVPNDATLAALNEIEAKGGEIVKDDTEAAFDAILRGK